MIPRRWLLAFITFCLVAGLVAQPVFAQSAGILTVTRPETDHFPTISMYFKAYDASGAFVDDLTADNITVLEDEQVLSASALDVQSPGVQVIAAFNPGPTFSYVTAGKSRYESIRQALIGWANNRVSESPTDDFSMTTAAGINCARLANPSEWAAAVQNLDIDVTLASPTLESLNLALDLATDPNPRPNMERAILFITPILPDAMVAGLPDAGARAELLGVRIYVWLVGPVSAATSNAGRALQALADRTDGKLFVFSGAETLPDPETYFSDLRNIYKLTYDSAIRDSGSHTVSVRIEQDALHLESQAQTFDLSLEVPNPIFLSPPSSVTLDWVTQEGNEVLLEPDTVPIQIMVEFPDGYERSLTASRLYVDGQLAVENTTEPFDSFDWQVSQYETDGTHTLRVEVDDMLGMTASTISLPIQVLITPRQAGAFDNPLVIGAIALAGLVLVAGIVLIGYRGRRWLVDRRPSKEMKDPVTQPVAIHIEKPRQASAPAPSTPLVGMEDPLDRPSRPAALARLVRTGEGGEGNNLPVTSNDVTIGSSPRHATLVINSPSVSPMHARITLRSDGHFRINDEGSQSGTWVNYAPVSTQGIRLQNGDLVQFGKVAYRFELASGSLLTSAGNGKKPA